MKNLLYLFLLGFVGTIIFSCVKENNMATLTNDVQIENRDATVWICHKPEGNNPHAIYVDESAVEAHLGHGDVLLDVDGDGYTAANACGEGSMDDCDDEDAAVNPGAEEVCGDGIDNNCDGNIDEGCFGNCTLCNYISELQECNTCWEYTGQFGCGDLGLFGDCGSGYVNVDGCDWRCWNPVGPNLIGDAVSNANCEAAIIAALPQCGRMIDVELTPEMQEMVLERIANLKGK